MKTVKRIAAQGDILLRRARSVPKGAREVVPQNGRVIVTHSESGHEHYLHAEGIRCYEHPGNPLICYLRIEGSHADLLHARPWDTHETLRLPAGTWQITRQREMSPEGWREVVD